MPVQRPPRPLPVLASVLAAAGIVLAVAAGVLLLLQR